MKQSSSPRIHFASQLYSSDCQVKWERQLATLQSNLRLPFVVQVTVFLDGCQPPWSHPLVQWRSLGHRASFADFLELMQMSDDDSDLSWTHLLFANSDIVFDDGIAHVAHAVSRPDWTICLTRRELNGSFPAGVEPLQTQDAWLVARQLVNPLLLDQLCAIRLGIPGCEHLFAAAMVAYGFSLWNPSEDCHVIHTDPDPKVYDSNSERYWGLYAYVPPCRIQAIGTQEPGVFFSFARFPGRYYLANLSGS